MWLSGEIQGRLRWGESVGTTGKGQSLRVFCGDGGRVVLSPMAHFTSLLPPLPALVLTCLPPPRSRPR